MQKPLIINKIHPSAKNESTCSKYNKADLKYKAERNLRLNSAAPIAKSRMDKRRVDFNTLTNTPTKRIQIADGLSP